MGHNPDLTKGRYVNTYIDIETWKRLQVLAIMSGPTQLTEFASALLTKAVRETQPEGICFSSSTTPTKRVKRGTMGRGK